jgi:hypothetical protein
MDNSVSMIDETVAFEADREWIDTHFTTLLEHFAEHWIAVKHGTLIASEVDLGELLSKVPDLDHTCIEFINGGSPIESL